MQMAYADLLDFITVDLLTNNLNPESDFFVVSRKKISHGYATIFDMK
jgi:hypothetical protein